MRRSNYIFIVVIIFIISSMYYGVISNGSQAISNRDGKVVMVIDLIRHGDRAPIFWSSELMGDIWNESEIGNLTTKGRKNARDYGITISSLYPEIFYAPEIEVYTTNFTRTMDTAKEVLVGILGKSDKTIPIKDINEDASFKSRENKNTNEIVKFISKKTAENYPQELKTRYESELTYINKLCGTDFSGRGRFIQVADAMLVSKKQKNARLCSIPDTKISEIIQLGEQIYSDNYKNNIQNFLVSKDLLLSIIDTLLLKKTKSITTNYKLMVMHDGNITPMIRLLAGEQAIDEGKFPDFNASIRFELIEQNDDFYVQVKYNGTPLELSPKKYTYSWSEFLNILLSKILEL